MVKVVRRIDTHIHNTRTLQEELEEFYQGGASGEFVIDYTKLVRELNEHLVARLVERETDVALLGPRASRMRHHIPLDMSARWTKTTNEVVAAMVAAANDVNGPVRLFGMASLPQSPKGASLEQSAEALEYWVTEKGFVGCYVDHNPSGNEWNTPPLSDPYWDPLWKVMQKLGIPGTIHVSDSTTPAQKTTGDCYINADTTAIVQLLLTKNSPFERFPGLKLIIPHGGGALLIQWDRLRGLAQDMKLGKEIDHYMKTGNLLVDSILHGPRAMKEYFFHIPRAARIGASETLGAVNSKDPKTDRYFDDTFGTIVALEKEGVISADDRSAVERGTALTAYSRLPAALKSMALEIG